MTEVGHLKDINARTKTELCLQKPELKLKMYTILCQNSGILWNWSLSRKNLLSTYKESVDFAKICIV